MSSQTVIINAFANSANQQYACMEKNSLKTIKIFSSSTSDLHYVIFFYIFR